MADRYIYYATTEETKDKFFGPQSRSFWHDAVLYQIENRVKPGDLKDGDVDLQKLIIFEAMLRKVQKNAELMAFINKTF